MRFNAYTRRIAEGRVLLILDCCTAQGNTDCLPAVSNFTLTFLSPQITSHIQPCDAGIISYVKALYKRELPTDILNQVDLHVINIYKIIILSGIESISQCWKNATGEAIKYCCEHCSKLNDH